MEEVPEINHAFEVARESKLTRKELDVLEKREMFIHDSKNAILKAQQDAEAKGRKEGREEGKVEGREEGAFIKSTFYRTLAAWCFRCTND
ncbi:hypothetical protein NIES4071_18350 [Calothrix sp. NIES-4071]|nr:hypothetical protein NIES4071_18350 [Calothrix sp. NIES-4071]BAZ56168.1 hypothetical protein NIES4105_18300 [Calothrix sp. NIES-4105]